jgi:HK97 gp10 family phage protein
VAINPRGLATNTSTLTTTHLDFLIDGGLERRASSTVRYFALVILDLAQTWCPVDTGHLKNSLQPGGEDNVFEFEDGGLVAVVGTSVLYAVFVEFGTRNMRAQPYLTPAVEATRNAWARAIFELFGGEVVGL